MEGGVAVPRRALEESGKRKGELNNPHKSYGQQTLGVRDERNGGLHLQRIAGLERAPDKYGGERYGIAVQYGTERSREAERRRARTAHIHPVIKQYAASGIIDSCGSTSDMRNSWRPRCALCHGNETEGEEDTGMGRAASASLFAGGGDNETPEDML